VTILEDIIRYIKIFIYYYLILINLKM